MITETQQHISERGLENSSARLLPSGTVCLSRTASVGFVVQMGTPMATSQDFVNWVCGPQLSSDYLRYLLMAEQATIRKVAYGTTHQTMYYPDAKALHVLLPSILTQRTVADVLGALDDKIAANARLRACADGLCAAWFSALADGSAQGILGEIADINRGTVRVGATTALRYLDISSVGVGDYDWPEPIDWEQAPGRARRSLAFGDTVWSTVRPGRRSHALVLDDDPEFIGSTGLAVLTSREGGPAFLYEATRTEAFTAFLESVAEGSAYPAVRAEKFTRAPIPDVSQSERQAFEDMAMPVRLRAHAAAMESRHLANLRDALLPHLMSGRLSVRQAETLAEQVL